VAQKIWRLVVTELGNADSLHEVSIEAGNWMTALKVGRKKLGEDGGVPTGASCAVAPDGKVTIHDPLARRSYVLVPGGKAKDANTQAAPAEAPKPDAQKAADDQKRKKQLQKTIAYDSRTAKKAPSSSSYSVPPPDAVSGKGNAARSVAPAAAAPAVAEAPRENPVERVEPRSEPVPKIAASEPPPAAEIETASGADFRLLSRRDEAPTDETPLFYRERVYAGSADLTSERAEEILRGRFAELRESLAQALPGKFFHLAIFDHEFAVGPDTRGRPLRPPIATLVYKDWRGEAVVQFPLEESRVTAPPAATSEARAPSVPAPASPSAAPAPSASPHASATQRTPSAPPPASLPAPAVPLSQPPAPMQASSTQAASENAAMVAPAVAPIPIAEPATPFVQAAPEPLPNAAPSVPAPAIAPASEPPHRQVRTSTDEHDARLAHAFEAAQDLLFLTTPVEGLDFVVRLLGELVPCEAVSACLYDIDTDEFRFVALTGPGSDERRGEAVPRSMGIMGVVGDSEDSSGIRLAQPISHPRFDPGVDGRVGLEPHDVLYQPVTHHNRLLGVLQLLNRAPGRGFSQSDADLVAYVARQTAEFLHQARYSSAGPMMSVPRR
jgi:hypothetical protein